MTTLGAFGLLGCDFLSPDALEYGCGYADYRITGTVIDADSSKAIEGIKIRFKELTTYSDAEGDWQIAGRFCIRGDSLHAVDVDGEANRGTFMPDSLLLNPGRIPFWSNDERYLGLFVQKDIVITMKKTP